MIAVGLTVAVAVAVGIRVVDVVIVRYSWFVAVGLSLLSFCRW